MSLHLPSSTPAVDVRGFLTPIFIQLFTNLFNLISRGESVTVPVAKLTPSGTNGSMTFVNGILTQVTDPT